MSAVIDVIARRHEDCSHREPCAISMPRECPSEQIRAILRGARAQEWTQLTARHEGLDGWRHYLKDEPIHCGDVLELQCIEFREHDGGEYVYPLQQGLRVRYEASFEHREKTPEKGIRAGVYMSAGGHSFFSRLEAWMRFRLVRR